MTAMFCCILVEEEVYEKQNTIISKDLLKVRNHHKILLFFEKKEKT